MTKVARLDRERDFHNEQYSDKPRTTTDKFYSIVQSSRVDFLNRLLEGCKDTQVLEYGCGPGTYAFQLANAGAQVTGIDISDVAIRQATERTTEAGLENKIRFLVMNAEELAFPDQAFDLVCGVSILHHLDLENALVEISRVLKPGGRAAFIEPLGHNVFINAYRRATPNLRSHDEHPLLDKDLGLMRSYFPNMRVTYYHLSSILAIPFRKSFFFEKMVSALDRVDRALFAVPGLRSQAWQVVVELRK